MLHNILGGSLHEKACYRTNGSMFVIRAACGSNGNNTSNKANEGNKEATAEATPEATKTEEAKPVKLRIMPYMLMMTRSFLMIMRLLS